LAAELPFISRKKMETGGVMFGVKAWMKAKRSGGGTAHLLATWGIAWFVALACTVLIGLEVSRIVAQRSTVIANARLQTANLTRSLLQHAELTFRTADAILIGVVERLEHEKSDDGARERLKAWFSREVKNSAQFTAFGVLDEYGTMIVNLLGENAPAQFADREYFLYHRSHKDDVLRIGRPVRSQSNGWLIPVTRRFNKPDGSFGGVALAAINPLYFQDFYDRLELVGNSAVILVSTDGTLLVRRPFVEANIGRDMTNSKIFAQLKNAPSGSLEIKASIDGVTRFNSYEQGHTYPIFVAVAQSMDELLAPWKANAIRRLIETAVISGLILLMGVCVWCATKNLAGNSIELSKTNTRFDAALANMPTGLSMFDADGRLMVCNERYIELYGMSGDLVKRGADIYDIVAHRKRTSGLDQDARAYVDDFRTELNRDGKSVKISRLDDGRVMSVTNTAISGGGWIAIHEDITERVSDEEALTDQAAELARINLRFDAALSHMTQGLSMFDERKRLVVWNKRFAELYDVPEKFLKIGTPYEDIIADRLTRRVIKVDMNPEEVQAKITELSSLARDSHRVDELADGRFLLLSRQAMPGGGWLSTIEDITERKRAEAAIVHLARHDVLTGLANRAEFNEKLEEAGKRLKRGGAAVTVMMLDLDRFKAVNDMHGHPAGDELLVEVGRRLKSTLRETDLLARLGGDEFAIIQEGGLSQREGAIALALRITNAIAEPFELGGFEVNIGTSIGIAMAPEHGNEPEGLLKSADLALYAAKAQGRSDYRIYQPDMLDDATSQQLAESELRDAIAHEQFELHYQPVIDVKTRQICGVEALIRWRHPQKGLIGPDEFIPLAESSGLIIPIGEWVLQRACNDAAAWPSHIKLAINISAVQFKRGNLFEIILCALVESGISPERLELEITETWLLDNQEAHLATIRQLKNLGILLALDDFGTGYSSVTYLTNFPFDKIKIDRTFTREVLQRRDYAAVVSSVLALARGLDKLTTVEGIETEAQFEYMRIAGVDLAQGYLFSRPVPASELDFAVRYPSVKQNMVA
jgi:diguanylate cyclase (GGDEF)-like protein/PAS domain S-box-containing protein